VTPGQLVPTPGLYLLDVVPEGTPRWGYPNINDNAEIAELVACGAHLVLFTTGRGSVVGSAISPVVKVCANPVVGRVVDRLVAAGGTAVFEETGELIGCEHHMAQRAVTPELGVEIVARVAKAADYYTAMGHGSFAPGNAEGGLTTLEEKSLGAYSKSGSGPIHGVVLKAKRHDIGNPIDWLKTNLVYAAKDAATWQQIKPLLTELLK